MMTIVIAVGIVVSVIILVVLVVLTRRRAIAIIIGLAPASRMARHCVSRPTAAKLEQHNTMPAQAV